jgi:hypothetical protein
MTQRIVVDTEGRSWTCTSEPASADKSRIGLGGDFRLTCQAPDAEPVNVTVGWQWESMSDKGLARIIADAARPARQ